MKFSKTKIFLPFYVDSLGVEHDGDLPTIRDAVVEQVCANSENEDFLMSPSTSYTVKDHLWSECSLAQIRTFIRYDSRTLTGSMILKGVFYEICIKKIKKV